MILGNCWPKVVMVQSEGVPSGRGGRALAERMVAQRSRRDRGRGRKGGEFAAFATVVAGKQKSRRGLGGLMYLGAQERTRTSTVLPAST